jgi:hypothetical protein
VITPVHLIIVAATVVVLFVVIAIGHARWLRAHLAPRIDDHEAQLLDAVVNRVTTELRGKLETWNASQQITHAEHLSVAIREQVDVHVKAALEAVAPKPKPVRKPRVAAPAPEPEPAPAPVVELVKPAARKAPARRRPAAKKD